MISNESPTYEVPVTVPTDFEAVTETDPSDTPGASESRTNEPPRSSELAELAHRHLWMNFTRLGEYSATSPVPIIVRGEGVYVYNEQGRRYFDGLSSLFTSQLGHGNRELAEAARAQSEEMAFFPVWTYAHPRAIELAAKLASLAPGDLNRVFLTSGGGEANETAWKLARQYFKLTGHPKKEKVISRDIAYHGTGMGSLAITGLSAIKTMFEPLVPGALKVPNTNWYRAEGFDDEAAFGRWCADQIEAAILAEGPDTVAAVFLEPVQNAGGCFTPPPGYFARVREICDQYNVLLVADEVITGFGRLGYFFASEKYDIRPDIITCAKGMTSAYAPLGAMIASDRLVEPFLQGTTTFFHGSTYSGHPVACAVALKNIEIMERLQIMETVRDKGAYLRTRLEELRELPIVGDIRGDGLFYAIELVKDQRTKETFNDAESEALLRGYLSSALYGAGLMCRIDDRGDPVVQLCPPLVSTTEQLDEMVSIVRSVLEAAPLP